MVLSLTHPPIGSSPSFRKEAPAPLNIPFLKGEKIIMESQKEALPPLHPSPEGPPSLAKEGRSDNPIPNIPFLTRIDHRQVKRSM